MVNEAIEKEQTPYYDPARFYPARIEDALNNRYHIATKLGYGSNSTTRLARDLSQFVLHILQDVWLSSDDTSHRWRWSRDKYIALKIHSSTHHSRKNAAQSELDILRHM